MSKTPRYATHKNESAFNPTQRRKEPLCIKPNHRVISIPMEKVKQKKVKPARTGWWSPRSIAHISSLIMIIIQFYVFAHGLSLVLSLESHVQLLLLIVHSSDIDIEGSSRLSDEARFKL
jgi:hypothetical protein